MNNKHIYTSLLLASLLFLDRSGLMAQQQDSLTVELSPAQIVPARLFHTSRDRSTGAVSTVQGATLNNAVTPNLTNTLYGRLPGLTVLQNNGEPGNDDASLAIRGNGSYGYSPYGSAKIFVDGFEVNQNYFRSLSPDEIGSVSILKDAAALATFGMRGANGVIWVTTKRGVTGKSSMQFQTRTAVQSPITLYRPLRSYDYARLYNQAFSNDKGNVWSPVYSDAQLQQYRNGKGIDVDWYDQVLKKNDLYNDANLVFRGGSQSVRYAMVMDYVNQGGLYNVPNTDTSSNETYKRYNLRANLDIDLSSIFEARVDIGGRIEQQKFPNYGNPVTATVNRSANFTTQPIWNSLSTYPSNIYPIRDSATGNWSGTSVYPNNPVATIRDLGWRSYKYRTLSGNFELKEKLDAITPGLYAREAFSFNSYSVIDYAKTSNYARYYNGVKSTNDNYAPMTAGNLGPDQQQDWKQAALTIGYEHTFDKHHIASALDYQQSDFRGDGFYSTIYRYQNISGRANYSYDDRLVGELGFSWFGSDAFAAGHRWGFYPALSTAWIISHESFLKNSKTVSYLKLRASAGRTGNTDSDAGSILSGQNGRYLYQQYYGTSTPLYTGDGQTNGQTGLYPLYIANKGIFAERSMKYNAGVDLTLFRSLEITVDAFLDKRSGIVSRDNSIPGDFGTVPRVANIGKQTNRGLELTAGYSGKKNSFTYSITGMLAYNKSRIDDMGEIRPGHDYTAVTGKAVGTPLGLVADGFYDLTDFNANGTLKGGLPTPAFGAVQPGDLKYKDIDGNGIVDNDDRTAIGKPDLPQMTYAFSANIGYKGFDLGIFLQGVTGSSMNILGVQTQPFLNNGTAFPIALNAWAYYPGQGIDTRANATFPRLSTHANDNNYRSSSFWIRDRSFLRVRNMELGYSLPQPILKRTGLEKLRIFVGATNPVTISRIKKDYDLDPETPFGYPALKSWNAGLSLSF